MLIDIEKFVQQELPPNKRKPVHIALATALFSPINGVINSLNKYEYDSQFDLGTPGQVAVLEYILQSYIDGNIRVTDGTGSLIDFRVLIPSTLTVEQRGDVVRYIERYRLKSKRYEVVDSISWGGGNVPVTPLAWYYGPVVIDNGGGNFNIRYALNQSKSAQTILKFGSSVLFNNVREYQAQENVNYLVTSPGTYSIQVGDLIQYIEVSPALVTDKPAWLNKIAYTHDVDTLECTFYFDATEDVQSRIEAVSGAQPSGVWGDSNTWVDGGESQFAQPNYSELARYNPTVLGSGGIIRSREYYIYVRRTASPSVVFQKKFTTTSASHVYPPTDISLVDTVNLPACALSPTLGSIFQATETFMVGQFAASSVFRFNIRIKEGSTTVRNAEMVYEPLATDADRIEAAKPTKLIQFFNSDTFTFVYAALTAGSRTIEIEATSCKGTGISSKPFVIVGTPLAFETGYPKYTNAGGVNNILIRIKTAETQAVKVKNTATNAVLYDQNYAFTIGNSLTITPAVAGNYLVTVGALSYTLQVLDAGSGGAVVAKVLSHSLPYHIKITITGSDKNWRFYDVSNYPCPPGHKFRYRIAGENTLDVNQLDGYVYNSNSPVRILKGILKDGYNGLWDWADSNGITIHEDASPGFSYNNSIAQTSIIFIGGTYDGFVNPIPDTFDPAVGNVQYLDIAPAIQLPTDHAWIVQRGVYTIAQILAKGATHIPNGQLDWGNADYATVIPAQRDAGITYSDVPLNNVIWSMPRNESIPEQWVSNPPGQGWPFIYNLQVWPNGPLNEADSIGKANISPVVDHACHIGETEENWPAISSHWPMWGWFYTRCAERLTARFTNRGISWYMCHNYFHIGYPDMFYLGRLSASDQKAAYNRPVTDWPATGFQPGGTLAATNTIAHAVYLGAPDKESVMYDTVYLMGATKKYGKKSAIFAFLVHEWRPNNHQNVNYPDGTYYQSGKVPICPADTFNLGHLGHIHGNLTLEWGGASKSSHREIFAEYAQSPMFFPTGSTELAPMPHFGRSGYYPYTGLADIYNLGVKHFADLWKEVEGGTDAFLKYRLDGGAWITPSNTGMDEIIDAKDQRRGYVFSRRKSGKIAYYWLNQYGGGASHSIEIVSPVDPAVIWTGTVSSNMALSQIRNI
ncbi:hypothetical protein [Dyadobacter frigoris]|uniref:Uncharacterized protein n=1 Tax=Dyadobacter frigoris TaxID=2576211 RepID=A0A4U6CZV5_9BACT|nr:hypothetical protein [Dyadobacter frigoris]TKT89465.1 hypothetical protein FDK13_24290 [Dyadobacter frigoris]